jgi:wyosine [tRNA(Phe)-imidazoG37] synthetase (radical SAM superfamily)
VDRRTAGRAPELDVDAMGRELESTVRLVSSGTLLPPQYARLSPELRRLSHVALSGDGEPTLCPRFLEAVQAVAHLRARRQVPFFKVVLITNASRLEEEQVLSGLQLFTRHDEVWAKLDGGTQDYVNLVNAPDVSIDIILSGILSVARVRPVVIQSLFPLLDRKQPSTEEISAYASRLNWLKERGAKIRLVQVYSATRPPAKPGCGHLSLKSLSAIAQTVRQLTNLNVEVF